MKSVTGTLKIPEVGVRDEMQMFFDGHGKDVSGEGESVRTDEDDP
jgi:hypothetical protein